MANQLKNVLDKMLNLHLKNDNNSYEYKIKETGLKKGEKLKEILLTDEELKHATSNERMWIIKQI